MSSATWPTCSRHRISLTMRVSNAWPLGPVKYVCLQCEGEGQELDMLTVYEFPAKVHGARQSIKLCPKCEGKGVVVGFAGMTVRCTWRDGQEGAQGE